MYLLVMILREVEVSNINQIIQFHFDIALEFWRNNIQAYKLF